MSGPRGVTTRPRGWPPWKNLALILLLAWWWAASSARAQQEAPQPRSAFTMHGIRINQIRATPDGTRVLSVSEDKTVRVWRLSDLGLLRVLRVPSDPGSEGAIRALAIAPDSRSVYVGGWTGWSWFGHSRIYRFDLATGRMSVLPATFPGLVSAMGLSPDGRWLAVGLSTGGLRVLDLATGHEAEARRDTAYLQGVRFVEFGPTGVLATTAADGCIRLYDTAGVLVTRQQFPPPAEGRPTCSGAAMGGVRFSPDGSHLAYGYNDRRTVVVLRIADRAVVRQVDSDEPGQASLCCPIFSADGETLLYHGLYLGSGPTPLYRLRWRTAQPPQRADVGRQRFTNLLPLSDGGLVFSTDLPSLVRLSRDDHVLARHEAPKLDLDVPWDSFGVSDDGRRVRLPGGGAPRLFEPTDPSGDALRAVDAAAGLRPPLRTGSALVVDTPLGPAAGGVVVPPRIDGTALPLQREQAVRAWAGHARLPVVALGTEWSLLLAGRQGKILWEVSLLAPVRHVAISGDGRWVVALVADGTVRWYRREDGSEMLAAFVHGREPEWIAWRPDGDYASSARGDEYFGWLVNRGADQAPDFYKAVDLERQLYRPASLQAAFDAPDAARAGPGAGRAEALLGVLRQAGLPRVTIESVQATAAGRLQVAVSVEATSAAVEEVSVYVNGIPALAAGDRRVSVAAGERVSRSYEVTQFADSATVRVEAETARSLSADETMPVTDRPAAAAPRGRLWIVSAGVTDFRSGLRPLPNAARDAEALAQALEERSRGLYTEVRRTIVTGSAGARPVKANVTAALAQLREVSPHDTTVVFLASHGLRDPRDRGEYVFLTEDTSEAEVKDLLNATSQRGAGARGQATATPNALRSSELTALLRRIPGRRVLIIDSCHAGAADRSSDPVALVKRSASAQVAVLSAARGGELSYEAAGQVGHGAFTLALLDGLRGPAARDRRVTLASLYEYSVPQVDRNIDALIRQTPLRPNERRPTQRPQLAGLPVLLDTSLALVTP